MYFNMVQKPLRLLKKPRLFLEFYIDKPISMLRYKITKKKKQNIKFGRREVVSLEEANRLMYEGLMSDKPLAIARNGGTESNCVLNEILVSYGATKEISWETMINGKNSSGIFPTKQQQFQEFSSIYKDAMGASDLSVYWGHIVCEKYILDTFAPNAKLVPSRALEPFGFSKPWTKALKGKKVLVIHPFEKTILSQYKNRDKLFKNPDVLPEFDIKTIKAVQSIADAECGFDNWTQALNYMKLEIEKVDFDIAIIGCGAYALPLMAHCKKLGKKAVILGGLTQILFGIKGARWEASRPDIVDMYNDYWVRPNETERPKGCDKIGQGYFEFGPYW